MAICVPLAIACVLLLLPVADAFAGDFDPRIRVVSSELSGVLSEAQRRSATIRYLIAQLNASDVVVYLEVAAWLPCGTSGRLQFVGAGVGRRYVRIGLSPRLSRDQRIALLGHELQHALEVASAPQVVDGKTMAQLYRRIGFASRSGRNDWFDTASAVDAGREVERELAGQ